MITINFTLSEVCALKRLADGQQEIIDNEFTKNAAKKLEKAIDDDRRGWYQVRVLAPRAIKNEKK